MRASDSAGWLAGGGGSAFPPASFGASFSVSFAVSLAGAAGFVGSAGGFAMASAEGSAWSTAAKRVLNDDAGVSPSA
ncbi:hypothetical protein [Bradyrhizobium sp. NAS96.2]|uniref:hypothetical protein n=1 Tax=Bradyrhizobium sp. NAS96.2 TaxID=1680160 RepID=UPI001FD9FEDE|nr:hypothetical protein [Bradyrhizobium sp. NAS96.2]